MGIRIVFLQHILIDSYLLGHSAQFAQEISLRQFITYDRFDLETTLIYDLAYIYKMRDCLSTYVDGSCRRWFKPFENGRSVTLTHVV